MHNCFFVVLLSLTLTTSFIEASSSRSHWWDFRFKKTTVVVRNELEGERELRLHCKSEEYDLGLQVLRPHHSFSWKFRQNFFRTTQFYCSMEWGEEKVHRFDIYIYRRDYSRCENCLWIVKQNGPCFYDEASGAYDFCYPWSLKA
ncbi:unnamed protein product [Linum tenue]|uniref:S-protein homolog n=1 Tax=Linum tenue TaxID=586396 RepID=A0AAV0NXA0_9ROSI|nr:unnamed protein product [Linum tenue]